MPSAVAESLFHRLIDSFPPRRAYAPAAFEREPMPAPVTHFLKHWLRHRLRHEVRSLEIPHSEWFDYEHEVVQQARQDLVKALIDHGHFPAMAWEGSLREAAQQVTTYLVRPVATLSAFVYRENKPVMPAEVVSWRLGYFKDYPYYLEATRLYVEKHEVTEFEQTRFVEMLHAIDQKFTKDYDAGAWLDLMAPLFDLVRRAGIGDGVPVRLLTAFFQDKDAEAILDRLARHQQHRSVEALDEDGLRRVLEDADEPVAVAPPMPPAETEQPQGAVPRWKQFQRQQPAPQPAPPPARKPPQRGFSRTPDDAQAPPHSPDARPRWMQYHAEQEPPAPASTAAPSPAAPADLALIEQAVLGDEGAGQRDLFVTHLFARSLEAYERVLRQLHATSSWPEASKIIADNVFRAFKIDIYSDPAILFTDTVEAGYLKREA